MIAPARRKISPPMLAARWGVAVGKVVGWIKSGELRAVNLATTPNGRPRYMIDEADIEAFERRRSTQPAPEPRKARGRPRKPEAEVIEFF